MYFIFVDPKLGVLHVIYVRFGLSRMHSVCWVPPGLCICYISTIVQSLAFSTLKLYMLEKLVLECVPSALRVRVNCVGLWGALGWGALPGLQL